MKEKLFLNGLSLKSKSDDMRRLRRYFLQRASMEIIDATDANRRRKDEVMKNVQIPYELFVSLLRYHLMEDNDCLNEITDQNIKSEIIQFVEAKDQPENFDKLAFKIDQYINKGCERLQEPKKEGDVNQKNLIWNYCLLDSSTNRSYGNAIFPAKRRRIIQKDKGENGVSFIPPCTKNVFLKYYNQQTNVLRCWERQDAKAYLMDINNVLSIADFIEDQKEKIDKL